MSRRGLFLILKSAAAVVLVGAVGRQFHLILTAPELSGRGLSLRYGYFLPCGLLYLGAHSLWAWYWSRLLAEQGVKLTAGETMEAYFVSQFGKYVPGKAGVVLLRVTMLRPRGIPAATIAATATYETLTNMAAGALIAAALLPWSGAAAGIGAGQAIALAAIAALPLLAAGAVRAAGKARRLPTPSFRLLISGFFQSLVGWCLLALSLRTAVLAAGADISADFLHDLSAVALSYVAGFVVLVSPGGLGAREYVFQQVLSARMEVKSPETQAAAAAVALLLRGCWTAFEIGSASVLWVRWRLRRRRRPPTV